ncbi:putative permease, YjgP/YjgQ family [Chlamydiales bacterium STE3]|nr:putative permease, YjgP/YjgQ family [Chlamydiales bacterium STE3]
MLLIWEKYFLKELIKSFCLFLGIFYGLYVLIDYSSHMSGVNYHHTRLRLTELAFHYSCEFLVRSEILIPFALLIATVKVLCQFNTHNELVALLAAGYSKKRLIVPFLGFALLLTSFMFLNMEFAFPKATRRLQQLEEKYARERPSKYSKPIVHHLVLEDGALLLFKSWNPTMRRFEETFWIRSIDEIWKMALLYPYSKPPEGLSIDVLKRAPNGEIIVVNSMENAAIKELRFNKKRLMETITPPDELSISELAAKLPLNEKELGEKEALILTAFYRKLIMPWLPLLVVLGVATFCMTFTRQLPLFFIYSGSIFGLVAIYLIINAASVLGERQVLSPLTAILTPFACFSLVFIVRFMRMK